MKNLLPIFEKAGEAACATDSRQRIVFWNEAAVSTFGLETEEVLDHPCWQIFCGRTETGTPICSWNCPVISQLEGERPVDSFDMVVRTQDDIDLPVNVSTIPIPASASSEDIALFHLFRPIGPAAPQPGFLRLHMLGPLRVQRPDGSIVRGPLWKQPDVRGLLIFLGLRHSTPVPLTDLVEAFWPHLDFEDGMCELETALSYLTQSLEPGLLQADRSRYICRTAGHMGIAPDVPLWLDTEEFNSRLENAAAEPHPKKAIRLLRQAIRLYRGDFLIDFSAAYAWALPQQDRLQQRYLWALEKLGSMLEQQGDEEAARRQYLSALIVDPSRSSAFQKLVDLSLPRSDRADLLRYCQRLAVALRSELDVLLSEELRQLIDQE